MKKSCGIFTNIAPLYSRALWYKLTESEYVEYSFYSSRHGFSGIKTIDINESKSVNPESKLNWFFLNNIMLKNILLFQTGIVSNCLRTNYDTYILYGEMNSFSSWIAALICKARKKPLLFWGHGLYGNENILKKTVRLLFYKLADYHLVYGNRSRNLMIMSGFNSEKVITVYNSLDYDVHKRFYKQKDQIVLNKLRMKLFPKESELPIVIFIGRITKEKKISYMLEAAHLSKRKGINYNCLIVGGGSELETLQKLSVSLRMEDSVNFYGPCYDEDMNAKLIMLAECCVSPGEVGLTAIHSMSLGIPVITHNNIFNQGPEAEAVIQNRTGLLFEENNIKSLSDTIDDLILNKKKVLMEKYCIEQVSIFWNPAKQASIIEGAVISSLKEH